MTTRALKMIVTAMTLASLGSACSSDSKPKDAGRDAQTDGGGSDATLDVAADVDDGGNDDAALTAAQARGKYLVDHVIACGDCHTPFGADGRPDMSKYLAGNPDFILTPGGDRLPSRNLTNDETGLKTRSDEEIKAMILDGRRPPAAAAGDAAGETVALNPVMPYYVFHNMTEADADAIVAYLRVVPPVVNDLPRRSEAFDVPAAAPPLDPTAIPMPADDFPEKDSAIRGRYLTAQVGLCVECHTPHNMPGSASVLDTAKMFQGGEDFSALFAGTLMIKPVSKNLTSDPTTGLGNWTVAEIVSAVKEGKSKDGSGICPPMPSGPFGAYGGLTSEDATDIANYLKSLAPAVSAIPDMCMWPPMAVDGGAGDAVDASAATDVASDTAVD